MKKITVNKYYAYSYEDRANNIIVFINAKTAE